MHDDITTMTRKQRKALEAQLKQANADMAALEARYRDSLNAIGASDLFADTFGGYLRMAQEETAKAIRSINEAID